MNKLDEAMCTPQGLLLNRAMEYRMAMCEGVGITITLDEIPADVLIVLKMIAVESQKHSKEKE